MNSNGKLKAMESRNQSQLDRIRLLESQLEQSNRTSESDRKDYESKCSRMTNRLNECLDKLSNSDSELSQMKCMPYYGECHHVVHKTALADSLLSAENAIVTLRTERDNALTELTSMRNLSLSVRCYGTFLLMYSLTC